MNDVSKKELKKARTRSEDVEYKEIIGLVYDKDENGQKILDENGRPREKEGVAKVTVRYKNGREASLSKDEFDAKFEAA